MPKLLAEGLEPVEWEADPSLEWAPPGHGDVFTSLATSGMLDTLLERGSEYLFLSNSDNLGASLDPRILTWFAREELPFLSEVVDRTEADRKGGHLARRGEDGGLVLRETAQVHDEDQDAFEDIERHRYFNANNIWVNLRALKSALEERDGVLGLPMIVNKKTVDPRDSSSPEVLQLETAMGAAIGVFDGAAAIHVPRARFAPVKTTSHLLVVRSDAYELADDWTVRLAPDRDAAPIVELSDEFKLLPDFEERFPAGPPSLIEAERLEVEGDVHFGRDVRSTRPRAHRRTRRDPGRRGAGGLAARGLGRLVPANCSTQGSGSSAWPLPPAPPTVRDPAVPHHMPMASAFPAAPRPSPRSALSGAARPLRRPARFGPRPTASARRRASAPGGARPCRGGRSRRRCSRT